MWSAPPRWGRVPHPVETRRPTRVREARWGGRKWSRLAGTADRGNPGPTPLRAHRAAARPPDSRRQLRAKDIGRAFLRSPCPRARDPNQERRHEAMGRTIGSRSGCARAHRAGGGSGGGHAGADGGPLIPCAVHLLLGPKPRGRRRAPPQPPHDPTAPAGGRPLHGDPRSPRRPTTRRSDTRTRHGHVRISAGRVQGPSTHPGDFPGCVACRAGIHTPIRQGPRGWRHRDT